jgi:hypothetical protein
MNLSPFLHAIPPGGMTAMPTKTAQMPTRQEDGDREPDRNDPQEVRSFGAPGREPARNDDSAAGIDLDLPDDPAINTHGSDR